MLISFFPQCQYIQTEVIALPSQSCSLTYNASSQSPTWSDYDSTKMTLSGVTSGTDAGTYTATFTPKSGYCWSDKTTTPKDVDWVIGKANGTITLSKNIVSLTTSSPTDTVTVSNASGAVSVSSASTSTATASISDNTITITGKANGNTTITVNVASNTNYNSTSKTISVSVSLEKWIKKHDLPYGIYRNPAIMYNNNLYLVGVEYGSGSSYTMAILRYNTNLDSWDRVTNLPSAYVQDNSTFRGGQVVVYNNELHLLGGGSSGNLHYKWNGSTWTYVGTLPIMITNNATAVAYKGLIHMFWTNATTLDLAHYTFNGSSWTLVTSALDNFHPYPVAVIHNDMIHLLGSSESNLKRRHEVYNGTSWISTADLPSGVGINISAVDYNNQIHILGGQYGTSNHYIGEWGGYSASFSESDTIPYQFYFGTAEVFDDKIHLLGSASSTDTQKYHYVGSDFEG